MSLGRLVSIEPQETRAVLWSFAYFFSLLCSYYILRPVRDEMGIAGGVENLQWVFTGTFVLMLAAVPIFGAASRRFPRHTLLPVVYGFFLVNLLMFYALFLSGLATVYVARAFFIWVSVFNLFVVSVFWSFMSDLFSNAQARRLFGFIAAGGSAGAVLGPALTGLLASRLGPVHLLPISALFLVLALLCIGRLVQWVRASPPPGAAQSRCTGSDAPLGGGVWGGLRLLGHSPYLLGIGAYILLYTTLSTFLYFQQAHIVRAAFDDPGQRTAMFAAMDFAVNLLTVLGQVLLTHRLVGRFGLGVTLAVVPALLALGLGLLAAAPVLAVLVAVQVMRRAGNYALSRPAREMLFTVVTREERYKAKNVIDTLVYRGGDAASGWAYAGLGALGLGLSAIALVAVPIAVLWLVTGLWLGRRQEALRRVT